MTGYSVTPALPIVFFDGYCGLCSRTVKFLLKTDKNKRLFFAPLQGETYKRLFTKEEIPFRKNSVVFLNDGVAHYQSDAVLEIVSLLPAPWKFMATLKFIPSVIRDGVYGIIARNRNRIWGTRKTCYLAEGVDAARMLP